MIELSQYQCEICKTVYKNKEECQECESHHTKIVDVIPTKYHPYKRRIAYPINVNIVFDDGETVEYRCD